MNPVITAKYSQLHDNNSLSGGNGSVEALNTRSEAKNNPYPLISRLRRYHIVFHFRQIFFKMHKNAPNTILIEIEEKKVGVV